MGKEDFSIYWPGTDTVRSRNNAFCLDHDGPHIDWAKEMANAGAAAKITADVERRRKAGRDPGAFYGISQKADELIGRHGGAYSRAKPRVKSGASKLLESLKAGSMESAHLAPIVGTTPKKVRDMLRHYIEYGRVVMLKDERPYRYALVEAA